MTKERAPLSFEQALARIAGRLPDGWNSMAAITGRSPGTIRAWGDPDRREEIPLPVAAALDLAYVEAGGDSAPMYEAYGHVLEQAALAQWAPGRELAHHAALVIKECGDAGSALVLASQPGACDRLKADAKREVSEALEKLKRALPLLEAAQQQAQPP